jgi:hypothetical protein
MNSKPQLFETYFLSTLGEAGLTAAYGRALKQIEIFAAEVKEWRKTGNGRDLLKPIMTHIEAIDTHDLRLIEVPLRIDVEPQPGQHPFLYDTATRAFIVRFMAESVAKSEKEADRLLLSITNSRNIRATYEADFLAALALAERMIDREDYDDALECLQGNLSVFTFCPATQFTAYKAYAGKDKRGDPVEDKRLNSDDLSDRFCSMPFEYLSTVPQNRLGNPEIFACACMLTMPYPVSKGTSSTVAEVWNGPVIQELRRSVLDGDYKYCSRMNCGFLVSGRLPKKSEVNDPVFRKVIDENLTVVDHAPRHVLLAHDASCNLACPSCRSELVNAKKEARDRMDEFADRVLIPLIGNASSPVMMDICGDGDPFGSKHYRRLIYSLNPVDHPHVKLRLITNGMLLTPKEWEQLGQRQKMILSISVSIDAATAATYEDVRRPGKWDVLVQNMEHLGRVLKFQPHKFYFALNFVVQKKNYREMPGFVRLGKSWNANRTLFQRVLNLGAYEGGDYLDHDVTDTRHPEHQNFRKVLTDPILQDPIVDMYTLSPYLDSPAPPAVHAGGLEGAKAVIGSVAG